MRPGGAQVDARLIVGDLVPNIKILPLDRVIEAADGSTIMEAAHEHGLYWPTTCGGEGICIPHQRDAERFRNGGGRDVVARGAEAPRADDHLLGADLEKTVACVSRHEISFVKTKGSGVAENANARTRAQSRFRR